LSAHEELAVVCTCEIKLKMQKGTVA